MSHFNVRCVVAGGALLLMIGLAEEVRGQPPLKGSPPSWEPTVRMTDQHAGFCLVKVGDAFPNLNLLDLSDNPQNLAGLRGERLTVIAIWNSKSASGQQLYQRFVERYVQPFADASVKGIAINQGDTKKEVLEVNPPAGKFANLLDAKRDLWKSIAKARMPRVYLLDAKGKILWFDIEYSLATHRELENAVRFYLQE